MTELTPRQIDLLKLIIREYTDSADPVGSEILEKKYHLGVSPATIRNDMVSLTKHGYLEKAYFSAGRVPTSKAFRFYIKYLMEEKELSTAEEVSSKSDVWDYRDQKHRLIDQATRSLANRTHMMAVSTTDNGEIHVHGVQHVLAHKEFEDVAKAREIFIRFEEPAFWERLLERFQLHEEDLLFLFDDDYEIEESASVFGEFQCGSLKGVIGVVGPRRMHYEMVVPNVRYFSHLLEELIPA